MDKEFSKDISVYKKKGFKGFSIKEWIIILVAIAFALAVSYFLITYLKVHMIFTVYIIGLISAPIMYIFLKKTNGYSLTYIIKRKKELRRTERLPYKSYEMEELYFKELRNVSNK